MSEPIKDKLVRMYAQMNLEDKQFLIELLNRDILVFLKVNDINGNSRGYFQSLDNDNPTRIAGTSLQLNCTINLKK
tara:strand:+ start:279 stop:506 length:228 start_codon:yes stop_codon:yes gene_type:complete